MTENKQYLHFSACYISLNVISSCFSFPANDRISFFMVKQNFIVYTYDIFFTYSSIGSHLRWFHKLTTTDAAIINTTVQTLCGMLTYFLDICSQEWMLNHAAVLISVFIGASMPISMVAKLIYILNIYVCSLSPFPPYTRILSCFLSDR